MKYTIFVRANLAVLCIAAMCAANADTTRVSVDGRNFKNVATGGKFIARGANYTRMSAIKTHNLFKQGVYSPAVAEGVLTTMATQGYNTVRVFVDPMEVNGPGSIGLDQNYLSNLKSFIQSAKIRQVYVQVAFASIPWAYTSNPNIPAQPIPSCSGSLTAIATNSILIEAKKSYVSDVINYLKANSGPVDNILSYSIENEFMYKTSCAPLDNTPQYDCPNNATMVSPAPVWRATNAGTFDVNSKCGYQALMDANMVQYINAVTAAIKAAHPAALVTMGFYADTISGVGTKTRSYWAFYGSNLDFLSLHYDLAPNGSPVRPPNYDWRSTWTNPSLTSQVNSIFEATWQSTKPILIEELYINKANATDVVTAGYMARDAQIRNRLDPSKLSGRM